MAENAPFDPYESIRYIPAQYTYEDSHNSALNLILTLRPEWRDTKDTIEFVRFTDGITNTVRCRLCACEKGALLTHHARSFSRPSTSSPVCPRRT